MKNTLALLAIVALALVALLAIACGAGSQPEVASRGAGLLPTPDTSHFTNLYAQDLTLGDDLSVTDDSTLGGIVYLGSTDLTVTDGTTPTISYDAYALDSAAAVTITLAACSVEGQVLTLIGDDANTITINDTNIRTSDGNAATLGQYDVLIFICQDTEWVQIVKTANS